MPLEDALGLIDPHNVLDDVIRQRAPDLAQGNGMLDPQTMMDRLIRSHVYGKKAQAEARQRLRPAPEQATEPDFAPEPPPEPPVQSPKSRAFEALGREPYPEQNVAARPQRKPQQDFEVLGREPAPQPAPGILESGLAGLRRGGAEIGKTAEMLAPAEVTPPLADWNRFLPPEQQQPHNVKPPIEPLPKETTPAAEPMEWSDVLSPASKLGPKIAYGTGKGAASLAGGIVGGAAGTALGGPPGGIAGAGLASGAASLAQSLGPYYAEALKTEPDPDKAFDFALKRAETEGAITGVAFAAFGFAPFKSFVKDLLLQAGVVQPAISAGGQAIKNVVEGKPVGEGVEESIPGSVFGTLIPGAAMHVALGGARGGSASAPGPGAASGGPSAGPTPRLPPGGPTASGTAGGGPSPGPGPTPGAGTGSSGGGAAGGQSSGAGARQAGGAGAAQQAPGPQPFKTGLNPKTRSVLEEKARYYQEFPEDEIASWSDAKLKNYVNVKFGMGSRASDEDVMRRAGLGEDEVNGMDAAARKQAADEARSYGVHAGAEPAAEGTREAPVEVRTADDLRQAEAVVETDPTPAQAEAGNYQKGHVRWNGLDISIENPAGSIRKGPIDEATGEPAWQSQMAAAYGYFKKSAGADGDHVDVFMGPSPDRSDTVYVLDQKEPEGGFDEHKALIGFTSPDEAIQAYLASHDEQGPARIGGLQAFSVPEFKHWLKSGDTKAPASDEMNAHAALEGEIIPPTKRRGAAKLDEPDIIEGTVLPEHRQAIETALRSVGEDPANIEPPDLLDLAAKAHAEEGLAPAEAVQTALVRAAVDAGVLTREQVQQIYGKQITQLLHSGEPSQRGIRAEEGRAGSRGPSADNAEMGALVPRSREARQGGAGGEAAGRVSEAAAAGHPARAARVADNADGGKKSASISTGRAGGEAAGGGVTQGANAGTAKGAVARRAARAPRVQSIVQFIASRGGIDPKDPLAGDVRAIIGAPNKFVPGYGPLIRKGGKRLDNHREAAVEAGYIIEHGNVTGGPGQTTINTLLDHLDTEMRGTKQYAAGEEPEATISHSAREQHEARMAELAEARGRIAESLKQVEYPVDNLLPEDMRRASELMIDHDMEPLDAIERAAIENEQLVSEDMVTPADEEYIPIEGFDHAPDRDAAHEAREAPASEGAARSKDEASTVPSAGGPAHGAGEGAGRKPESSAGSISERGQAGEPAKPAAAGVERTAAGEQRVLPGAERISDRELAQRRADAGLKPKAEQKAADEGLFGDSRRQTDLVDMARKPIKNSAMGRWTEPVYHGTDEYFDTFDMSKVGAGAWQRVPLGEKRAKFAGDAAYFTSSRRHAAEFGVNVIETQLNLENPVRINAEKVIKDWHEETSPDQPFDKWLASYGTVYDALSADEFFGNQIVDAKAAGHDGLIVDFGSLKTEQSANSPKVGTVYVVFRSDQIRKSESESKPGGPVKTGASAVSEAERPPTPKAPQAGPSDSKTKKKPKGDPIVLGMSLPPINRRSLGLPSGARTPITEFRSDQDLKAHPDYKAAKAGSLQAAENVVRDLVSPANIESARRQFGADAIYVPVIAEEQSGHNQLPPAVAARYAAEAGGRAIRDILQVNRAFHTGASAMERLVFRAIFDGPVERGGRYVLVDDVMVMGSTLADLAHYIQRNGGEVAGVVTLVNAGRSGVLTPTKAATSDIKRRYGNVIGELFQIEPIGLSADEAQYLRNFRDADALRTRVAAAKRERSARLLSKGVREGPTEDVAPENAQQNARPKAPKPGPSDSGPVTLGMSAPAKPAWYYSAAGRAIDAAKQEKASPNQWIGTLRNTPGVKPEEVQWLGIEEWLREQKGTVTKQQVQDFIRANQIEVKEVEKSTASAAERRKRILGDNPTAAEIEEFEALEHQRRRFNVDAGESVRQVPKFSEYQLPGGENYRELLLTLPNTKGEGIRDLKNPMMFHREGDFNSSHWDEPNVLAHVRFNDRVIGGKKTLFVEEIQSDWHQSGRKRGYGSKPEYRLQRLTREGTEQAPEVFTDRAAAEAAAQNGWRVIEQSGFDRGVPDAPFKTTWPELSLKRMLRYASEHGYEKIAWAPGEVQAARYDLSKQIDKLIYFPKTQDVRGFKNGHRGAVIEQGNVTPEKLSDFVGKEAADKLINKPTSKYEDADGGVAHELSGLDLKVGGEGMRSFYDRELVNTANKLGKKFGARVERGALEHEGDQDTFDRAMRSGDAAAIADAAAMKRQPVHIMDITPALRDAAIAQGFPLFQAQPARDGTTTLRNAIDKLGEHGNAWVDVPEGRLYLRAGQRPDIGRTLEIPNIEFDEEARGKGAFSNYLKLIEEEARQRGFDAVYIEQLFNERLANFLRRNGYKSEPSPGGLLTRISDQATLYKPVGGYRVFVEQEPLQLTDGAVPAKDTPEWEAAAALAGSDNKHAKAIREINELIGIIHRSGNEARIKKGIPKWEKAAALIRQWQRDKVAVVGEHLTEEEREARFTEAQPERIQESRGLTEASPPDNIPGAERIVGAAVLSSDGRVFIGGNHILAIDEARKAGADYTHIFEGREGRESDGGFFTSKGRYVSRQEAADIANAHGQFETDRIYKTIREEGVLAEAILPRATRSADAEFVRGWQGQPLRPAKVAHQGELTPAAAQQAAKFKSGIEAIIHHIVGDAVKIEFRDIIPAVTEGWGDTASKTAGGQFLPVEDVIEIALHDPKFTEPSESAFHESWHAVEDHFIDDREMALLKREEPRLREIAARSRDVGTDRAAQFSDYEVRAMAFEAYAAERARGGTGVGMHIGVRRIFERLMRMFRQIGNYLRGLGFRTYEDIFAKTYQGEMKARPSRKRDEGQPSRLVEAVLAERAAAARNAASGQAAH